MKIRKIEPKSSSRRSFLVQRSVDLGLLALGSHLAFSSSTASAHTALDAASRSEIAFDVPAGACDCHVHVYPDVARFPFSPGRNSTPPQASAGQLLDHLDSLRMDRVVIVTPSAYENDNAATLHAIRLLGPHRARGVAVIPPNFTAEDLSKLQAAGVVGIRANLQAGGVRDAAVAASRLANLFKLLKGTSLHLQIFAGLPLIAALKNKLVESPVPIVFDHFAGARGSEGTVQKGFDTVLELLKSDIAYVKISAPYRVSLGGPAYADLKPIAQAMIATNENRILWGSDWPHPGVRKQESLPTDITTPFKVDDVGILNLLEAWEPNAAVREKILVKNPAFLFQF
ncbi:putative TIM-barrel fold metal-dependent hydrolase [Acidovorax sp. 100]|uniref:amidohydrolase family protein n=1 Tax=Acidovorax sp. 100 TaxID=2135635 RepID=UPI000EFA279D|nr:amidohydrolase family protein [Acidovorax sp. 100]RMA59964.1 putative TIM-barrel fold metal-dependent hydrolase [Acidovorax sp. 100]